MEGFVSQGKKIIILSLMDILGGPFFFFLNNDHVFLL